MFREFYKSIGLTPRGPAWINQLSIADYLRYFELIGFQIASVNFSTTKIDQPFYERFSDVLERFPRYDLERDFIHVHLRKPAPAHRKLSLWLSRLNLLEHRTLRRTHILRP